MGRVKKLIKLKGWALKRFGNYIPTRNLLDRHKSLITCPFAIARVSIPKPTPPSSGTPEGGGVRWGKSFVRECF